MDNDDGLSDNLVFALYGTQQWGIRDYFNYSDDAPATKHYKIPVGSYYTGNMNFIVLAMDDDSKDAKGHSQFSNIKIYEQSSIEPLPGHLNPPVARQDSFHMKPSAGEMTLDVVANDATDSGESIHIIGTSAPSAGGLVEVKGGSILYTPKTGFTGVEAFEYTISDGFNHNRATAKVTIVVNEQDLLQVSTSQFTSYDKSQDIAADLTVHADGLGFEISGNGWKKIPFAYTVTAQTIMEFDFSSDARGEVHGIGFDNDDSLSPDRVFKLYGTQVWGIAAFNDYNAFAPDTKRYRIPVGQYFTGTFKYLVFANDDDTSPAAAQSVFRNISIYEE